MTAELFAGRVNNNHDAPIRLLSRDLRLLHRRIHYRTRRHQKLARPIAARLNLRGINFHQTDQVILHTISPALTKIQIVFVAAKGVCVTFNLKRRLRIASDQRPKLL